MILYRIFLVYLLKENLETCLFINLIIFRKLNLIKNYKNNFLIISHYLKSILKSI